MATVSKVEEITAILRTEILRGQYRPGERLPSERDLSARFETNRGAIREVVKKLEQLGIIAVAPGGVRVLPLEEATLEVLGYLLELGEVHRPELIGQMLDVLGAMTSLSIRSALAKATDNEIEDITLIVHALIAAHDKDDSAVHEVWIQLSEKLISIHRNLILRLVANGLRAQFIGQVQTEIEPEKIRNPGSQHLTELLHAIQDHNGEAAASAVIRHFQTMKRELLALTATQTPSQPELSQNRSADYA
ncbi:MAG: FadR/GntR family transcriptional regulator [Pseudomonadales bacterium]